MVVLVLLAAFAQPPAPAFTKITTNETTTGAWTAFGKALPGDLISIRRTTPLPSWPHGPGAILINGDRIPGEWLEGDDLAIRLKSQLSAKGLRIPFPAIRVLWLTAQPAQSSDFPDRYRWLNAERRTDVVLLRNGDTVIGDIETFTPQGQLRIKRTTDGMSLVLPADSLSAVAFNPSLSVLRKVKGPISRLVLMDGTRISLSSVSATENHVKGMTAFGGGLEVPISELVALDVIGGKATNLSELKPTKVEFVPFLTLNWPMQTSRTVKHRPIQLRFPDGISTFDQGLGMHPRTTVTYALGGKYRTFCALVGLDARTGQRGQAKVSILVDGQKQALPELLTLSSANDPVAVTVSLANAKELKLIVDFGPNGDRHADVNWADARLIE